MTSGSPYFGVLRQALKDDLEFEKRVRRPPTDPVNALLSLGYTLLTHNLFAAAEIAGMDPYDGFFHADKYGRPALALDLTEEFRGVVVDSAVMNVINRHILDRKDFRPGPEEGVYLTPKGWREFVGQYQRRLNTRVRHPYYGRRLTYQQCFEVQARLLAKVVKGELDEYPPFLTK